MRARIPARNISWSSARRTRIMGGATSNKQQATRRRGRALLPVACCLFPSVTRRRRGGALLHVPCCLFLSMSSQPRLLSNEGDLDPEASALAGARLDAHVAAAE